MGRIDRCSLDVYSGLTYAKVPVAGSSFHNNGHAIFSQIGTMNQLSCKRTFHKEYLAHDTEEISRQTCHLRLTDVDSIGIPLC